MMTNSTPQISTTHSRIGRFMVIVTAFFLISACAYHGSASIKSNPEGAEVVNLEDDTVMGVTPVRVWWRESGSKRKFVNVRLQKQGYRDKTTSFWVTLRHNSRDAAMKDPHFVEIDLEADGETQ